MAAINALIRAQVNPTFRQAFLEERLGPDSHEMLVDISSASPEPTYKEEVLSPGDVDAAFLAFLEHAVAPYWYRDNKAVHVAMGNIFVHGSPHPHIMAWWKNSQVHFNLFPPGFSWPRQIESWFEVIIRHALRRGSFASAQVLIKQLRDNINSWSTDPRPFVWAAANADETLGKVLLAQADVKVIDNKPT